MPSAFWYFTALKCSHDCGWPPHLTGFLFQHEIFSLPPYSFAQKSIHCIIPHLSHSFPQRNQITATTSSGYCITRPGQRKPGMFILRKFLLRSETFQSKSLPHTLSSSASYHTRLKSNQMKSPGRETLVRVNIKLCSLGMDTTDYYDLSAHPSTQLHFIVPTFHSQPLKGDFPFLIQLHCPVPVPCHNTERKLQVTEQRIPSLMNTLLINRTPNSSYWQRIFINL